MSYSLPDEDLSAAVGMESRSRDRQRAQHAKARSEQGSA
jgi:hypothetical protein